MASKIVWTENALDDLEQLKTHLESSWPATVLLSFLDELVSKLKVIETFPQIGRQSAIFPNRRRFSITKYNILIYSVYENEIVIEAIFDTRQDEKRIQF